MMATADSDGDRLRPVRAVDHAGARESPRLLSDEIAQHLAGLIIDGQLSQNQRLPSERDLAKQLGVSRTVVRDALAVLTTRGLVEVHPGRSTVVSNGSERATAHFLNLLVRRKHVSLAELIEARYFLEGHVAQMAAERASEKEIAALERDLLAMVEHRDHPAAFVNADLAFHRALAQAAQNRIFVSFLDCIRDALVEGMLLGSVVAGAADASITEHRAILEAVRAHAADRAQLAMSRHLRASYRQQVQAGYTGEVPSALGEVNHPHPVVD